MGVMSCSRKNCDNIMCNTYINSVGYVCNGCQTEFKEYINLKTQGNPPTKSGEIDRELKLFMETEKDTYTEGKETTIDDYFSENTK